MDRIGLDYILAYSAKVKRKTKILVFELILVSVLIFRQVI